MQQSNGSSGIIWARWLIGIIIAIQLSSIGYAVLFGMTASQRITASEVKVEALEKQLDRMDSKLDRLLQHLEDLRDAQNVHK